MPFLFGPFTGQEQRQQSRPRYCARHAAAAALAKTKDGESSSSEGSNDFWVTMLWFAAGIAVLSLLSTTTTTASDNSRTAAAFASTSSTNADMAVASTVASVGNPLPPLHTFAPTPTPCERMYVRGRDAVQLGDILALPHIVDVAARSRSFEDGDTGAVRAYGLVASVMSSRPDALTVCVARDGTPRMPLLAQTCGGGGASSATTYYTCTATLADLARSQELGLLPSDVRAVLHADVLAKVADVHAMLSRELNIVTLG